LVLGSGVSRTPDPQARRLILSVSANGRPHPPPSSPRPAYFFLSRFDSSARRPHGSAMSMKPLRVAFGNDHAAVAMRPALLAHLSAYAAADGRTTHVLDLGAPTTESVDYPDYAAHVAHTVACGQADVGVLICGSGIGMCIAANKVRGVRAALCIDAFSAEMSRRHNNANVLCLRAREQDVATNLRLIDLFLATPFEGGRHQGRVDKISLLDPPGPASSSC